MTAKTDPNRKVHTRGIQLRVFEYLRTLPGKTLTLAEIADACDISSAQASTALHGLRKAGVGTVENPMLGVWRFSPEFTKESPNDKPAIGKRMFDEIGAAKDGSIIIQDEDGNLYRAIEL